MTTYTITRALSKIKTLESQLVKKQRETFVTTFVKSRLNIQEGKDIQAKLTANLQSAVDIKNEILKIKLAVQNSNLVTKVKVAGIEMTVREAIETKALYENHFRYIADKMQRDLNESRKSQAAINKEIDTAYNNTVIELTKADKSISQDELNMRAESAIKYIRDSKEVAIASFDPTKEAETAVQEFDKAVSEFLDEIDFTLSETNAVTTIEVI